MIFDLLTAVIDSILLYRLYHNLLHFKYNNDYRYISGIVALSILIARYFMYDIIPSEPMSTIMQILGNLSIFLIALLFYKDSVRKKILFAFIFFVSLGLAEFVVIIVLMVTLRISLDEIVMLPSINTAAIILSKLIAFYVIEQITYRFKQYRDVSFSYMKELTIILFFNIILFIITLQYLGNAEFIEANANFTVLLITSCVLFISILACLLIAKMAQKSRQELDYQITLHQMEMENKMSQDMTSMVYTLRSLRHDMNNHINLMAGLLRNKQYDDLMNYLDTINEDISHANDFIFLDNKSLTVLLNSKMSTAVSKNINLNYSINVQTLPLPDMDLCILLGNLLDNAIEAAEQVPDNPYIRLTLRKKGRQYFIQCENTFTKEPIEERGRFLTTKSDKSIHGIGLQNMKNVVEKYDGSIDIHYDTLFHVNILLCEPIETTDKEGGYIVL